MGIARRLARDRAQAEALGGVEAGALHLPVVPAQAFGLPVLEKQFAVVGAGEAVLHQPVDPRAVQAGAVEEENVGKGRSEGRRGGKACGSTCSSRWSPVN